LSKYLENDENIFKNNRICSSNCSFILYAQFMELS
jgi:hypothetical protein